MLNSHFARKAFRRFHVSLISALLCLSAFTGARAHVDVPGFEEPLGVARLTLGGGKVKFVAKWEGVEARSENPLAVSSSLQITACGGADTGEILLAPGSWQSMKKNKGYRYKDPLGLVRGLRFVLLKHTKTGGKIKIKGSGDSTWDMTELAEELLVTFGVSDDKWCAQLDDVALNGSKLKAKGLTYPDACPNSWTAVQDVFERNGCTNDACHGSSAQGDLDLRPDVAFDNLVNVFSRARTKTSGSTRLTPRQFSLGKTRCGHRRL